eukprot:SAG31_NODE_812_length_11915_cov_64.697360_2_plen_124_part_00
MTCDGGGLPPPCGARAARARRQAARGRGGALSGAAAGGADAGQNADHGLVHVVVFKLLQYTIEINKLLWRYFKMLVSLYLVVVGRGTYSVVNTGVGLVEYLDRHPLSSNLRSGQNTYYIHILY